MKEEIKKKLWWEGRVSKLRMGALTEGMMYTTGLWFILSVITLSLIFFFPNYTFHILIGLTILMGSFYINERANLKKIQAVKA